MKVVLDASGAVLTVLRRPGWEKFDQGLREADEVLAPDLFVAEVANVFWKYHQFSELGLTVCEQAMEQSLAIVDRMVPASDLFREAFRTARSTRCPVYDMLYLVLARREGATLITADKALAKIARHQGVEIL